MTPTSVIKNMTTKKRPHAEEIIKQMKSLEEKEVGNVKNITRTQIVFYKPLPLDQNKEKIVEIIGSDHWDIYATNFKEVDMVNITVSQHNRLFLASDNREDLESFGLVERTDD